VSAKDRLKALVKRTPIVSAIGRYVYWASRKRLDAPFPGSAAYWENRYAAGRNSGAGSYAALAEFKAEVINEFVATHGVHSVVEFGCGDGNQLSLANYTSYRGYDVSPSAVAACRARFSADPSKSFHLVGEYDGQQADLALSLDVIYHLIEDHAYASYMDMLFRASRRYVIVYSSDFEDNSPYQASHVRHRKFTAWVRDHAHGWKLIQHLPNRHPYKGDYRSGTFSDFFIYEAGTRA
jgi:SAM-dependent methyltransferase